MKLFVKSRGNLRAQDYIYWLRCDTPNWNSALDHSDADQYLRLLDTTSPGLLLFSQSNTYHLLISGLSSVRREPSSPGCIRNTILFTEIDSEETVRVLASYALQHWTQLAQAVDAAIQVDPDPTSICGYRLNCTQLFDIVGRILDERCTGLGLEQRVFRAEALLYGGIGSSEWSMLSDELRQVSLPTAKSHLRLYAIVTKRIRLDELYREANPYLLCNSIQETKLKKNSSFDNVSRGYSESVELMNLPTIAVIATAVFLITHLLWHQK
ncbi:MAG TPA: hypothetical protein V6D10_11360 [Trichocoleus sp.]|jgi:hypothetical protein